MYKILKVLVGVLAAVNVYAQMPHEVLLLVNKQSQPSKLVANTFVALRGIPKRNIVYLDIPESAYGGTATITPEQFTKLIWEPANAAAKEQGIDSQILAWVYSVDFPIRVKTDDYDRKQMSVSGLTFMRNQIPGLSLVEDGKYHSKLFAGPNKRLQLSLRPMSLRVQKEGMGGDTEVPPEVAWLKNGLGDKMPLPSMMLGYIGEKGNDVETVLQCLIRGRKSDFQGKRDGYYFVMNDDVRSKCREWQFYPAVNELKLRGITATVITNFPAGATDVMGMLVGAEKVNPSEIKSFAPGAMAEHLTSWSAEFQKPQTKVTEWIKAGATGSAGMVVEPYSNPDKFPSARFFTHYGYGCTMLESFYQSIACPLQNLLLGDPLARPYAIPFSLKIMGVNTMKKDFTYLAVAENHWPDAQFLYTFLLDGKEVQTSEEESVYLRLGTLSDGYHELRAVAFAKLNPVKFNAFADKPIMVNRMGRSVTIQPDLEKLAKHEYGIKVKIGGMEMPEKLRLVSGEVVLDERDFTDDVQLVLDELEIGEGPNRVRVIGIYADGMEVSSPPVNFTIKFAVD